MLNKVTKTHPENPRVSDLRDETTVSIESIQIHWIKDISKP
jgi:hypothetical protein